MSHSPAPTRSSSVIHWDAAAGAFVKLTLDSTRRILARVDLEPTAKKGLLQHLFSTRVTAGESRAMADLMRGFGLLVPGRDQTGGEDRRLVSAALTGRFERAARRTDAEFLRRVGRDVGSCPAHAGVGDPLFPRRARPAASRP